MKKRVILTTVIGALVVIGVSGCGNKSIDGIYSCQDNKKEVTLTIKNNTFNMDKDGKKLSSMMIPKKENPSKFEQQLAKSMKLIISNTSENNYKLAVELSYQLPGEKLQHKNKDLGTLTKNSDGSLNMVFAGSKVSCVKK